MNRKNFIDLPFKSIIEKYDYYFKGKVDFIICELKEPNPRGIIYQMKVLKDGRVVTNKPGTNDLLIWNLKTKEVEITLSGHTKSLMMIEVLNDNRIVSLSYDRTIKIWNSYTGQCEHTLNAFRFTYMLISDNDQIITQETLNGIDVLKVWNPDTGICELSIPNNKIILRIMTLNNKLIFTSDDFINKIYEIKIWDLDSKTYIQTIGHPENHVSDLMKFEENRICRNFSNNTCRIWNIITGECEIIKTNDDPGLFPCLILPDKRMIGGESSGNITVLNCEEREITLSGHLKAIKLLKLLPDGRLISNSTDGIIKIWNLESYDCELTLNVHKTKINCLEILPDGRIITGGGDDNKFIVWK